MRLSKASLVAAALSLSAVVHVFSEEIFLDKSTTYYKLEGDDVININPISNNPDGTPVRITLAPSDDPIGGGTGTFSGTFRDNRKNFVDYDANYNWVNSSAEIVKTGGGVFQYNGFHSGSSDIAAPTPGPGSGWGYYNNNVFESLETYGYYTNTGLSNEEVLASSGYFYTTSAFYGTLSISRTIPRTLENNGASYTNEKSVAQYIQGQSKETGGTVDRFGQVTYETPGFTGTMRVQAGELRVSGYINQWVEYPDYFGQNVDQTSIYRYGTFYAYSGGRGEGGTMLGVQSTVLEGNGQLSFRNSARNITLLAPALNGPHGGTADENGYRFNMVQNLKAGDDNDQYQTSLYVGDNSEYRIMAYITEGTSGGIGILDGSANTTDGEAGRFYKAGAGSFSILNNAIFPGDIFLAGGNTLLGNSDVAGVSKAVFSAKSVNLVGDDGFRGAAIAPQGQRNRRAIGTFENTIIYAWFYDYKPGYAPAQEQGDKAAGMVLLSDQSIQNLQSRFAEKSGSSDADLTVSSAISNAVKVNPGEIYIAGTGIGTSIDLKGHELTIYQNEDGYYQGSIYGDASQKGVGSGAIIKKGTGTLAFLPDVASYNFLRIEEGNFLTNVQGLGYGRVEVSAGVQTLTILQNNAGTLRASLNMEGVGTLLFTTKGYVNNGGGNIKVGDGTAGAAKIITSQDDFRGNVIIEDGITVQFGDNNLYGGVNDTFKNASSITLQDGGTKRVTTLDFNNTNQIVRNLSGDSYGQIRLGRGNITVIQDRDLGFLGQITGVGNLTKSGAAVFALSGKNTYSGATTAAVGTLFLAADDAAAKSSALIIKKGAIVDFTDKSQHFGAFYGEVGAQLVLGIGTFTVGFSNGERAARQADDSLESSNYLASYTITKKSDNTANLFSPDQTKVFLASDPVALNNAENLEYAGTITGSEQSQLIKIGSERLTLSGQNDAFTGSVQINAGILRANADSLSVAKGISIATSFGSDEWQNSDEETKFNPTEIPPNALFQGFEVNAEARKTISLKTPTSGDGTFRKIGQGQVIIDPSVFANKGDVIIESGCLETSKVTAFAPNSQILIRNSGTLLINSTDGSDAVIKTPASITTIQKVEKMPVGSTILSVQGTAGTSVAHVRLPAGSAVAGGQITLPTGEVIAVPDNAKAVISDLTTKVNGIQYVDIIPKGIVFKDSVGTLTLLPQDATTVLPGATQDAIGVVTDATGSKVAYTGAFITKEANTGSEVYGTNGKVIYGTTDALVITTNEKNLISVLSSTTSRIAESAQKLIVSDKGTVSVAGAVNLYEGNIAGSGGVEKRGTGTTILAGVKDISNNRQAYELNLGRYHEENYPVGSIAGLEKLPQTNAAIAGVKTNYMTGSGESIPKGSVVFPAGTTLADVQALGLESLKDIKTVTVTAIDGTSITPATYIIGTPAGCVSADAVGQNITLMPGDATAHTGVVRANGTIVTQAEGRIAPAGIVIENPDDRIVYDSAGTKTAYNVFETATNTFDTDKTPKNDNTLIRHKDGTYTLTSNGTVTVAEGTLVLGGEGDQGLLALPSYSWNEGNQTKTIYADLDVAAGATLKIHLLIGDQLGGTDDAGVEKGTLVGAGTFINAGPGILQVMSAQTGFTGILNLIGEGGLDLQAANAFRNAVIKLDAGTELTLRNAQTFRGITGADGSVISLNGGDLTLDITQSDLEYEGKITAPIGSTNGIIVNGWTSEKQLLGDYEIPCPHETTTAGGGGVENPAAKLKLTGENSFFGPVKINHAILEAKTKSVESGSGIDLDPTGEIRFFADIGETGTYTKGITGAGLIGKSGAGTVILTNSTISNGKGIHIYTPKDAAGNVLVDKAGNPYQGTLVWANNQDIPQHVWVEANTIFQYRADGARLPDGTLKIGEQVQGSGGFAIECEAGKQTVKAVIEKTPLYTGLTGLIGDVELSFNLDGGSMPGGNFTMTGLFGKKVVDEAGDLIGAPTLDLSRLGGGSLTIVQNLYGVFEGTIIGAGAELIITGTKMFAFKGTDGKGILLGDESQLRVKVDGGILEVGLQNEKPITVVNSGTLFINSDKGITPFNYTAPIVNNGTPLNIGKNGAGQMVIDENGFNLRPGSTKVNTLTVTEGILTVASSLLEGKAEDLPFKSIVAQKSTSGIESVLQLNVDDGKSVALQSDLISGTGTVSKVGAGTLTYVSQTDFTGTLMVGEGKLQGNFTHAGDLINQATLAPGNSIGKIFVDGAFTQTATGTLEIEFSGSDHDIVYYDQKNTGAEAKIEGQIHIMGTPMRGAYAIIRRADFGDDMTKGLDANALNGTSQQHFIIDDSSISARWISDKESQWIELSPTEKILSPYYTYRGQFLLSQSSLNNVPGYTPHDGVGGFIGVLDSFAGTTTPGSTRQSKAQYIIGGYLNSTTNAGDLTRVVNNFSPLGYGSLVGMPAAAANAATEQLHARLEQRRYDMATFTTNKWEIYAIGTSNFASNSDGTSDATFDFNTYGGIVGADYQINETNLVGGAVEYTNGKADIHDGGGKVKMNEIRFTGYLTHMLSNWFYVDAGLSGGYMSYDAKRQTATGENKASPDGWTMGTFATIGTVFPVIDKSVYLNPYAGIEYNHYDVSGFTESGSVSRLKVDGFGYDSLRAKIGTGLSWLIPSGDWSWKVNVDAAYAHECLDTESKLKANFVEAGGSRFSVASKTLASDVFQIGPSLTLNFTDDTSIFASYRLEIGFDGEMYNNINIGFRTRF